MERIKGPLRPENPGIGYLLKRSAYEFLPKLVKRGSVATQKKPDQRVGTGNLERRAFNLSACLELLPGAALLYQGFSDQSIESISAGTYLFISGLTRSLTEISRDDIDKDHFIKRSNFEERRLGTIGL